MAGRFACADFVPLDAGHGGRRRGVMAQEEQAAVALGDGIVLAPQPRFVAGTLRVCRGGVAGGAVLGPEHFRATFHSASAAPVQQNAMLKF